MMQCYTPPVVNVMRTRARVIPVEHPYVVKPGETIAIPLYNGTLAPGSDWKNVLRYLGTVSIPARLCLRTEDGTFSSHRVAVFRVNAPAGLRAIVPVLLSGFRQTCVSCRTVHFLVYVK